MITKNFIKQCEQAEELQKWYKSDVKNVREGDRYICRCDTCKDSMFVHMVKDSDIDYINERDMTDVDPTYAAMVSLSGVGEFGAFWDDGGFIYLPTQERLQEMILPIFFKMFSTTHALRNDSSFIYRMIIEKFQRWINRSSPSFDEYMAMFNNLNELWLAFVMKEKYHKIWTGEKWVKADD